MKRLEICGNIASGKTTIVQSFKKIAVDVIFEDFGNIVFLNDFYKNSQKFAFETELAFTLQHYYQLKTSKKFTVSDFSLITDYAFALTTLSQSEFNAYKEVFEVIIEKIGLPQYVIKLETSIEEQLSRIKRRNRANELSITEEYLRKINNNIEYVLTNIFNTIKVVTINTEEIDLSQYDESFLKNLIREKAK